MRVTIPEYNTYVDFPDDISMEEIVSALETNFPLDKSGSPDIRNLSPLYGRIRPSPVAIGTPKKLAGDMFDSETPSVEKLQSMEGVSAIVPTIPEGRGASYSPSSLEKSEISKGIAKGLENTAGLVEGIGSTVSGLAAFPISTLAGVGKYIMELITSGKPQGFSQAQEEVARDLTYQPRTEMGKTTAEVLGSPFALLGYGQEKFLETLPDKSRETAKMLMDLGIISYPALKAKGLTLGGLIDKREAWKERKYKEYQTQPIINRLKDAMQESAELRAKLDMTKLADTDVINSITADEGARLAAQGQGDILVQHIKEGIASGKSPDMIADSLRNKELAIAGQAESKAERRAILNNIQKTEPLVNEALSGKAVPSSNQQTSLPEEGTNSSLKSQEVFKFMTKDEQQTIYNKAVESGDFEGTFEDFKKGFNESIFDVETGHPVETGGTIIIEQPLRQANPKPTQTPKTPQQKAQEDKLIKQYLKQRHPASWQTIFKRLNETGRQNILKEVMGSLSEEEKPVIKSEEAESTGDVSWEDLRDRELAEGTKETFIPPDKFTTTLADTGGYAEHQREYANMPRLPIEAPEAVEIIYSLLNKGPVVAEKIRAAAGQALGAFYPKSETIKLRADLAKNPDVALKVLQHEIGHLVDYLPEKTMARGNILGRIASLKKYMKSMLQELPESTEGVITVKERNAIRNEATKRILSRHGRTFKEFIDNKDLRDKLRPKINEMVKERIAKIIEERGLYTKAEIIAELKGLTQEWKPFDESANQRFTKYRYSSKELYADAFSVLLNDPALLKEKAPKFNQAFFNWLERKPEVKAVYDELQTRYTNREAVLRERERRVVEGYREGESESLERFNEAQVRTMRDVLTEIKRELVDKNAEIIRLQKQLESKGIKIGDRENPRWLLEQLPYFSSKAFQYVRDINNEILKPIRELGISIDDFGQFLQYRRVLSERYNIFNPQAMQGPAAIEQMAYLKRKLGDEGFTKLNEFADKYWGIRQQIIKKLEEANLFTPALMEKIKNNAEYVTFDIEREIEKFYGHRISGHIYKQIGTLKKLRTNPFTTTIFKDLALLHSADRKIAAKATVDMLEKYYPDEVHPAKTRWNGKFPEVKEIENDRYGTIMFTEGGKVKGYYVSKYIADSFKRDPYEANIIFNVIAKMSSPVKALLVSHNPFFVAWNSIWRDPLAWAKQMPKGSLAKAYWYAIKSIPDAFKDVFRGESTEDVRALYEKGGLIISRYYGALDLSTATEVDRILMQYGLNEKTYKNNVIKPFQWLWNNLDKPGQLGERLYKIGGYKYLKDLQAKGVPLTEEKIMHIVRTRAGSPDFKRAGTAVQLYNNILLFSNAGKEGWRASWEAYKEDKSGYIYRTVKYSIIPTVAKYLALIGVIDKMLGNDDERIKKVMEKASPNDLMRYNIIPVGLTEKDEAVYFVQPHDFTGQVLSGVLWQALTAKDQPTGKAIMDTTKFVTEGIPYTGLNPMISTIFSDIPNYLTGQPIIDPWSGREIISDQRALARRVDEKKALEPFLKYQWNKLGGASMIYRFPNSDIETIKSELGKIIGTPVIGRFMERFIRVSNYGDVVRIKNRTDEIKAERANESLNIRDAIIKNFGSDNPLSPESLYVDLVKQGAIKRMTLDNFKEKYKDIGIMRNNNPYINALMKATNEERAYILQDFLNRR